MQRGDTDDLQPPTMGTMDGNRKRLGTGMKTPLSHLEEGDGRRKRKELFGGAGWEEDRRGKVGGAEKFRRPRRDVASWQRDK